VTGPEVADVQALLASVENFLKRWLGRHGWRVAAESEVDHGYLRWTVEIEHETVGLQGVLERAPVPSWIARQNDKEK